MALWYVLSSVNSFFKKRMRSHSVRLDVLFLVGPFVYFYTAYVRTAKVVGVKPVPEYLKNVVDLPLQIVWKCAWWDKAEDGVDGQEIRFLLVKWINWPKYILV